MTNVHHLRLINGEEIVGDILGSDKSTITILNPLLIEEKKDESGSVLVLTKYIPFNKVQKCTLQKSHVITLGELHPELERYYSNSLKFSHQTERNMIKEISRVNILMEEALQDSDSPLETHKGSNSKH